MQEKNEYKLVISETEMSAEIQVNGSKVGPTFMARNPLITTLILLREMRQLDEETYNGMLSAATSNTKMPSSSIMMPHMNFGIEMFGMQFGTPFCEHSIFHKSFMEFFPLFKDYAKKEKTPEPEMVN
jgi:hypothetical protein